MVAELSGAAGSEIAFKVVDVTSTAKNVSFNTETTTYRTTNYTVAQIGFAKKGSSASYKVGEKTSYEIGRFELSNNKNGAEDKTIVLKSLKLKNADGLNLSETFKNVQVYRDSKVVSKNVTLDSKDMTIYFDGDELASGKKAVYSIFAEVAQLNEVNESVTLQLKKSTELVANEKSTNFRVAYNNISNNTNLETYTFKGGKVTFSNDSSMAKTVNGAQSATDVVLAKGTLTISEPIKLSNIILTGTATPAAQTGAIKNLKIEIGGTTYETEQTYPSAGVVVFKTTDDDLYVSKTSDVRVLVDVDANAADNATISFQNLNSNSFA
ncbi:hypothetical protein IJU97_03195 [bacterium]|nr:hypothetical protein [bacterium]